MKQYFQIIFAYKNISIVLLYIYLFYLMEIFKFSIISYSLWHFLKVHRMKKKTDWWFNLFRIIFIPTFKNIKIFSHFIFQIFSGIWQEFFIGSKKKKKGRIDNMSKHMRSLDACARVIFLITAYRPTWPTVVHTG